MKPNFTSVIALILIISISGCTNSSLAANTRDAFINNPFSFTILKNYSDDYNSIGTVVTSASKCPLEKENIADPAFCFLRIVAYDGLTVNMFSFDVLQGGTAEYLVANDHVRLTNGKQNMSKRVVLYQPVTDFSLPARGTEAVAP